VLTFNDCLAFSGVDAADRTVGALATVAALRRVADAPDAARSPNDPSAASEAASEAADDAL
jgi:hypothetical protein